MAPHYFLADCFEGSSDLAGTGSTLFSGGLFWTQTYLFGFFCGNCQFFFQTHTARGLEKLFSNCAVVSVSGLCGRLGFV